MNNIRDVLLKLHYLSLEINEMYQIVQRLKQFDSLNEPLIKKILGPLYIPYSQMDVIKLKDELDKHHIQYVTIVDENYPSKLKPIFMPPLVLFYQGNYSLLNNRVLAVIGSRNASPYGIQATDYFINGLVEENITIISGLALGIDFWAHQCSIKYNGDTIAVLGSGLLNIYPKKHYSIAQEIKQNHLLISEYPPYEGPKKSHFPFRNRIVSGLSDGILVIEAAKRSGTLITCDYGLDQGKDIYVVPNQIFASNGEGTNNLIKQGAKLVSQVSDILE